MTKRSSRWIGSSLLVIAGAVSPAHAQKAGATPHTLLAPAEPTPADPAQRLPAEPSAAQGTEASASPEQEGVGDIVVTAQKRSENLQTVPITINAVAPAAIENAGIQSTQGLSAVLPGLQILNIGNSLTPRVRGVGSGFTAAGLESPVATFVDGIYHAFAADIEVDYADVEQVALLKGPQGTLFGRNATGGVLQITTRQPSQDFKGSLETSLDNYLTSRSNVFVTGGLAKDVAASLSISYATQGEGYGTNVATGNDTYKLDRSLSAHGKVRVTLDTRTTAFLDADYRTSKGPAAFNFKTFPGFSSINPSPQPGDEWDSNRFFDSRIRFRGGGVSARVDHDFGFATLSAISGYRDGKNAFAFTPVTSAVRTNLVTASYASEQFTQEIQLVSPSSQPLTWTIGAFYFWNKAKVDLQFDFFDPKANPALQQLHVFTDQNTASVAGFGQATYKISNSTRLTGGVRYTYDKRDFDGINYLTLRRPAGLVVPVLQDATNTIEKPTWRLSLDHDLADRVLLYASYNRGIKSGGFNTTTVGDPPIQAEKLDAYEAGVKSQFLDNRVRLNIGGFYYDYSNIQVPIFTGGVPAVINAASAENYGLDIDATAELSRDLTLNASANLLHAEFTDFPNAPIGVPNPGNQGAAFPPGQNAAGNRLPFSPRTTYSLSLDYERDTPIGTFNFNVGDEYNSGFFFEADNFLRQRSYHFINASVAWNSNDRKFSARLFATNILNEAVASQANATPTGYNADYTNPPFRFGAGFKINF